MGHNFRFLVLPVEFDTVVDRLAESTGSSLWTFPEGNHEGAVEPIGRHAATTTNRTVWLGVLPPARTTWSAWSAGTDGGFVALVWPRLQTNVLELGEVFTPAVDVAAGKSLFPELRKELRRLAVVNTVAVSDLALTGPTSRGPKASRRAVELATTGVILRQRGVGRVRYLPVAEVA
jgi:hypothetical protein